MHRMSLTFAGLVLAVATLSLSVGCGDESTLPDWGGGEDDIITDTGTDIDGDVGTDDGVVGQDTLADEGQPSDALSDGIVNDLGADVTVECIKDSDCVDAPLNLTNPCHAKVCIKPGNVCGIGWKSDCCAEMEILSQDFEDGIGEWTIDDPVATDKITWSLTDNRKALGTKSLYFGDPECFTYYSGELDKGCEPVAGGESTIIRASAITPKFTLPPLSPSSVTYVAEWFAWIESEAIIPQLEDSNQPDQFWVHAIISDASGDTTEALFASVDIQKTTNGAFVYFTADLTSYSGSTMALRFKFDTLGKDNNHFEGVYIDEVSVYSSCAGRCYDGDACNDDLEECTTDICQSFTNTDGYGVCSYPKIPTCIEPECTKETVTQKCPSDDPCRIADCIDGACVYTVLSDDECCHQTDLLVEDFEDATADGFGFWSYQDQEKVKWQVTNKRSANGRFALYYGDPVAGTYNTDGEINFGEVTTPAIDIAAEGYDFLSFNLFIASEYDDYDPDEYYNPLGVDFFEVIVVENRDLANETSTRVWSSHNIYGTTQSAFIPVGIDLKDFKGKKISIRFAFNTSDPTNNSNEGVYVDDFAVRHDNCTPRDCMGTWDCGIDGVCKAGDCTDNVCNVILIGADGCCANEQDCDDGDECTADDCLDNECVHQVVDGPGCCVEKDIRSFVFDVFGNMDGFSTIDESVPGVGGHAVTWQLVDNKAQSGTRSIGFVNDQLTYDNGGISKGKALSPEINVPADGNYMLDFYLLLDIEPTVDRDVISVDVMHGDVSTTVIDKQDVPAEVYGQWFAVTGYSMDAFKGKTVKLRFSFDSVDSQENAGAGVFVDSITIRKVCPE